MRLSSSTTLLRKSYRLVVGHRCHRHRAVAASSGLASAITGAVGGEGKRCQHHQHLLQMRYHSTQKQLKPQQTKPSPSSTILPSYSLSGKRCLASQPFSGTSQPDNVQPTLFSLPNLRHPSDFTQLANEAIRQCDTIRETLASSLSADTHSHNPSPIGMNNNNDRVQRAKQILHLFDDISNIVDMVIHAAGLCRSVHASAQWRRCASDALGILREYQGNLDADERLYLSLRRFVFCDDDKHNNSTSTSGGNDSLSILAQLPPEYQRMAHRIRGGFERDGIHLSYTQREEARELKNVIKKLGDLFTNNITEKTDISTHDSLINTLYSPSPGLRKEAYMQLNTSIPENLDILDSLIRHRHLHSSLLGYKSYAHRAGIPEEVQEFLAKMEARNSAVFKRDMELILQEKKHVEVFDTERIEPWDKVFYTARIKAQRQHQWWKDNDDTGGSSTITDRTLGESLKVLVSDLFGIGSSGSIEDESSYFEGYFTLENSIEGMKILVSELFGITMKEATIPIEERWDVDTTTSTDEPVALKEARSKLRKFEFHHEEDGPLGTMYFDLYPRDGKMADGAVQFTIRYGRIRNDEIISGDQNKDTKNDHQLPIVALVCNFSQMSSPFQKLISHSEVETLYHEFGHGLHSLLSRTSFQRLSGTRVALNFVETPSQLFEIFSRDPGFLSRVLAKHYVTGLPMSELHARHLALSHADFRGIEVQTQIVYSKFDQALFGEHPCSPSLGGCTSTEMLERLHEMAGLPFAKGTHMHSRKFAHLVTYGAGYYTYLFSQTLAADIWDSVLAPSMASASSESVRQGGMKIWKEFLVHGGAKDPNDMIRAVLGRGSSVDPFFKGMS